MADFVDRVTVHFQGGDGGNGASSIRREKYKPLAGPDGGNGGRGGSIILRASADETSLLDFRYIPHRRAMNGKHGEGGYRDGKRGEDVVVPVPIGTVVFRAAGPVGQPKHRGEQLADLSHEGDKFVVARGGCGGLGNHALANKAHRAPGFALKGEPGQATDVVLELKSVADVALVGYPSAGKSSLIAAISAARPKIADYPFTTLVPNLGVVKAGMDRFTVADAPGLIPGASEGKGLGLQFLRHIERTQVIVHVIDCATPEQGRDPMSDYQVIENELSHYAQRLDLPLGAIPMDERQRVIVLTKADVPDARKLAEMVKPQFEGMGLPVFIVSAVSHEGLKQLVFALSGMVAQARKRVHELRSKAEGNSRVVIKPLEMKRNKAASETPDFSIVRRGNRDGSYWFDIVGETPSRWIIQTDFDNDEAVGYLADRLARLGVEDALRDAGAVAGDEVHIGPEGDQVFFNWDPAIAAGAEGLDESPVVSRGEDIRLRDVGYVKRRTNAERRRAYHEKMDRLTQLRAEREAERKAGYWADPSKE
ncbi:MAG: GTPase ObgE [Aeriscardovia sp.]|nr:GTPase ObgE [Aeriscardovia sp.]